jgi:hypothetical protein
MWIRLLIAINVFFFSVKNVEDTDLWGYFFWHITLICVLCQRTQIWGSIYFGKHRSEYDVRGHRSEEICSWKVIDLGVTSEKTYFRGQSFGRTWIWVWRNDWTQIWGKDIDLSLRYIYLKSRAFPNELKYIASWLILHSILSPLRLVHTR